jgi:AcrR family transcriptional regulator
MTPYDERLERLLTTAADVFAEKGYHPTTMRDLARATGMSLAGMYYYVRSKEDLLYLVLDRCFARVLERARELEAPGDPADRVRAFVRHHVAFFAQHMAEMKVLSHEAESLAGERAVALRSKQRAYADLLERLVGELAPAATPGDRRVAVFFNDTATTEIYTWYRPEGEVTPLELADLVAQQAVGGIEALAARGVDTVATPAPN